MDICSALVPKILARSYFVMYAVVIRLFGSTCREEIKIKVHCFKFKYILNHCWKYGVICCALNRKLKICPCLGIFKFISAKSVW